MSTDKITKLLTEIESLSVLELSDLVKSLEEKFGVTAAAPVAAVAPTGSSTSTPAEPAEEQTSFTVVLKDGGATKIAVIKALREINPNLGLKEAKDMTEQVPAEILKDAKAEDAKSAADKLKAVGATVELK